MAIAEDFYTVRQAADVIGCTPGRIRQLILDGTLTGEQVGDGENAPWLLHKEAVKSYAARDYTTGRPRGK